MNSSDKVDESCNSNMTDSSGGDIITFTILLAMFLITMFLLTMLLGCEIIYCLFTNRKLRDPVSALIATVTVLLMILSTPLDLLSALAILVDVPLFGDCTNQSRHLVVFIGPFQWTTVSFSVGLIATVQFLVTKYGKRITYVKVLIVQAALVLVSMVISSVGGTLGADGSGCAIKIRGSLCAVAVAGKAVRGSFPSIVMGTLLGYITPLVVTLAMSCMLHKKVKNSVVEMDSDHSVAKSVLTMSVVTILTAFFLKIPLLGCVFWVNSTGSLAATLLIVAFTATESVCILFLFITIHKTIRRTMIASISQYVKCLARPELEGDIVVTKLYRNPAIQV